VTPALGRWLEAAARVPHGPAVGGLLGLYAALAIAAATTDAATFDEGAHLGSGYAHLDRGDLRIWPEHPPLAKLWAALGLRLSGAGEMDYDCEAWRRGEGFAYGFHFLYGRVDGRRRPPLERLLPGRIAMIVLGLALGLVLYAWSRELWGRSGAVVTLLLYALSPLVLAHTHLVTTDGPAALGFATTVWMCWRFGRRPTWVRAGLVGVALGVALLLKTSCLLAIPIGIVLAAVRMLRARAVALPMLCRIPAIAVVAYLVLWAGYGFRYRVSTDAAFTVEVPARMRAGLASRVMSFASRHRLLPEGFTYAVAFAAAHESLTYINGEVVSGSRARVWYFFPELMLLKSTPAELAALGLVAVLAWRRRRRGFVVTYLAIGIAGFLAMSMASGIYMGQRHLMPLYALLYVGAGAAGRMRVSNVRGRVIVAAFLASHAVSSFSACPRYLAYFNFLGGGPERASTYVVDSNIDWGQDLSRLKPEMDRLRVPHVYLIYFGTADPTAYEIPCTVAGWTKEVGVPAPRGWPGPGDHVAISVTLLRLSQRTYDFIQALSRLKPVGRAGDSIWIYRLPER
jgi:hypothetical protein